MMKFRIAALAYAAMGLTACNDQGETRQVLRVASGHIVMPVSPDRPAAGYFTVEGGSAPVDLVAVTADLAQRVEMHQTVKEDGLTTMKTLVSAPVPVQGKLEFKPGGNHLMVWNINGAAVRAGRLPMVFLFSNNDRILFDLTIKAPDAAVSAGDEHQGH
ncbi:MAG: copper chaperone PCu(A)C [Sphingopyxis sp.]|nr:copper chaperone PCu(A)C [Sphingopyxis sp.]